VAYPGELQRVAAKAVLDTYRAFYKTGDPAAFKDKQLTFVEHFDLLGVKEHFEIENKYSSPK
jgi:2-methylisocitrate lyase-like PEP mutase family enzyme